MVMAKQTDRQTKAKTQKQGEGKRSWEASHPLDYCQTSCALLPMNEHTQSNVVLEPSLLVPMLQTQGAPTLLAMMVKQLYNKTSYIGGK